MGCEHSVQISVLMHLPARAGRRALALSSDISSCKVNGFGHAPYGLGFAVNGFGRAPYGLGFAVNGFAHAPYGFSFAAKEWVCVPYGLELAANGLGRAPYGLGFAPSRPGCAQYGVRCCRAGLAVAGPLDHARRENDNANRGPRLQVAVRLPSLEDMTLVYANCIALT